MCFLFDKMDFEKVLCLKIIFWYVIRILVFGIVGLFNLFLYMVSFLSFFMLNLNIFRILLIINICGL